MSATEYKQPTSVLIPISFAEGQILKEIETAHCLQASALQKESVNMKQEMTKVVMPVLTPDRAEKRQNGRRFKENGGGEFYIDSTGSTRSCCGSTNQRSDKTGICPSTRRGFYKPHNAGESDKTWTCRWGGWLKHWTHNAIREY